MSAINVVDTYKFDPTNTNDNAAAFQQLANDQLAMVAAKKPLPQVIFPEGVYKYSAAPANLAIPNADWEGQGYVELAYTGSGDALTFNGGTNGIFNQRFDGFHIVPTDAANNGLVLNAVHHSYFRVRIHGAGVPKSAGAVNAALKMGWCVCTHFDDFSVSPFDIIQGIAQQVSLPNGKFNSGIAGVWLDLFNNLQTTDCTFARPILETLFYGVYINNAGGCRFDSGTIEGGTTGILVNVGGYNVFNNIDMEGNTNRDIIWQSGSHDNLAFMCGNDGKLNVQSGGSNNIVMTHEGFLEQFGL